MICPSRSRAMLKAPKLPTANELPVWLRLLMFSGGRLRPQRPDFDIGHVKVKARSTSSPALGA